MQGDTKTAVMYGRNSTAKKKQKTHHVVVREKTEYVDLVCDGKMMRPKRESQFAINWLDVCVCYSDHVAQFDICRMQQFVYLRSVNEDE